MRRKVKGHEGSFRSHFVSQPLSYLCVFFASLPPSLERHGCSKGVLISLFGENLLKSTLSLVHTYDANSIRMKIHVKHAAQQKRKRNNNNKLIQYDHF